MARRPQAPPVVEQAPPPGPGHNQPPEITAEEALRLRLEEDNRDLLARLEQLEISVFGLPPVPAIGDEPAVEAVEPTMPEEVKDDATAARCVEFVRQLQALTKWRDERHEAAKKPFLLAGRVVDNFFSTLPDRVRTMRELVEGRTAKYLAAKAEETNRVETEEAIKVGLEYSPPPTPLIEATRIRSERGAVGSVSAKWDFEITDPTKVPREYCSPDKTKLRSAVTKDMKREIAGVRIFPVNKLNVR